MSITPNTPTPLANSSSPPPAAMAPAKVAGSLSPLDALKPLLNENGELELGNLQIGERVQQFIAFRDACNFNLPMWDTAIVTQFYPGMKLVPIPVIPARDDAWHGDDAKKMKLKEGHVEPKADFILKLGNIAGVILEKCGPEGINEDNGLWSCRYNAKIQMPNGEWLVIQDEGKDQSPYNNDGSKAAHVSESTRKKAKRNVVKNLLGIPTSMPEPDFYRPWIILKPVYEAGVSIEADRIIAERKAISDRAAGQLYSGQTIDVKPEPVANKDGEVSAASMKTRIREAKSAAELNELKQVLGAMSMTNEERKLLGALVIGKEDELSGQGGEVKL